MGIQALIYFFCTQNLELIVWDFISQLGFTASKNKTRKAPSPALPELPLVWPSLWDCKDLQDLKCVAYLYAARPVYNAYLSVGRKEGEREATPTSVSIFDSYDMKTLWFKFGAKIFSDYKMQRL